MESSFSANAAGQRNAPNYVGSPQSATRPNSEVIASSTSTQPRIDAFGGLKHAPSSSSLSPAPYRPEARQASKSPVHKGFVSIPNREDLLARLTAVSDEPDFKEKLYPLILSAAGKQLSAEDVRLHLSASIYRYKRGVQNLCERFTFFWEDKFLAAMAPNNPEVLSKAKKMWTETDEDSWYDVDPLLHKF